MFRRSDEAVHVLVHPALAILERLGLHLQSRALGEPAHEQPFDLDDEVARQIRIEAHPGNVLPDAEHSIRADDRHSLFLTQTTIDLRDLRDPTRTFLMLEMQDLGMRPVKVICDVRYL